jgi:hypothetical protein
MEQRSCNAYVIRTPARRPRILVEDDSLDPSTLDLSPPGSSAFEILVCTGPDHAAEPCPLVLDGMCPLGRPDVVVSALGDGNPWQASVRAAWEHEGVRVAIVHPDESPLVWPAHVGAAIRALLPTEDEGV